MVYVTHQVPTGNFGEMPTKGAIPLSQAIAQGMKDPELNQPVQKETVSIMPTNLTDVQKETIINLIKAGMTHPEALAEVIGTSTPVPAKISDVLTPEPTTALEDPLPEAAPKLEDLVPMGDLDLKDDKEWFKDMSSEDMLIELGLSLAAERKALGNGAHLVDQDGNKITGMRIVSESAPTCVSM